MFLLISVFHYICKNSEQSAIDHKNFYTISHINYNLYFFSMILEIDFIICLILLSQTNFTIVCKYKSVDKFTKIILSGFRLFFVIYFCYFIIPEIFQFLTDTWNLNSKNWWKSEDEQFITNECIINLFFTWIIWSYFYFCTVSTCFLWPLMCIFMII